ncbi:MAG: MFS transporter [Gemmatimonadetes bacterium]|nr:MFS transporter [Gemmatimonadota bacterium]MYK51001.1 MFS transporter [Gemmatimonadota bacterium]
MPKTTNRKTIISWMMYDFANSSFANNVTTFIYAAFFTKVIAENEIIGTALWSRGVGIIMLVVALLSPPLGALSDQGGYRKRFLIFFTFLAVIFTALLYFPQKGQATYALTLYIIACICFEMGIVFYNAFLPDIAPSERIGRISGQAWGVGYFGGLLSMAVLMVGFVSAETPWFGLTKETHAHIRATNIGVAIWFAIFSLPALFYLPAPPARQTGDKLSLAASYQRILQTFRELQRYREIFKLLLARLVYNDGLITVFAFGGIYAAGTFGFTFEEVLFFGIIVNIAAGIGAWCFGYLDDRLGGKLTIQITLVGFVIAAIIAVVPQEKIWFWIAGLLVGLFAGPNQSASRSLMGRFVPQNKETEFYGFYAFSGKATAFLGPLLMGVITQASGSQRYGMATVGLFFILGGLLLRSVDEQKGIRMAREKTSSETDA